MRVLLDTNAFIWWNLDAGKLSRPAFAAIDAPNNEIFFSAVSAWEIAIKYAKGLLTLPEEPRVFVRACIGDDGLIVLPVDVNHALHAGALPTIHRDPFDRLLVAQSQMESLPILTSDARIAAYGVEVIW